MFFPMLMELSQNYVPQFIAVDPELHSLLAQGMLPVPRRVLSLFYMYLQGGNFVGAFGDFSVKNFELGGSMYFMVPETQEKITLEEIGTENYNYFELGFTPYIGYHHDGSFSVGLSVPVRIFRVDAFSVPDGAVVLSRKYVFPALKVGGDFFLGDFYGQSFFLTGFDERFSVNKVIFDAVVSRTFRARAYFKTKMLSNYVVQTVSPLLYLRAGSYMSQFLWGLGAGVAYTAGNSFSARLTAGYIQNSFRFSLWMGVPYVSVFVETDFGFYRLGTLLYKIWR